MYGQETRNEQQEKSYEQVTYDLSKIRSTMTVDI